MKLNRIFVGVLLVTFGLAPVAVVPMIGQTSDKTITEADCTAAKLGSDIPITSIGEAVAGIALSVPRWSVAGQTPAYCSVDGVMAPMDKSAYGKPINFRVVLPATWTRHAVQIGGGGF